MLEACGQRQGGVVDQDVDAAEPVERLPDDRVGDASGGDIASDGEHALTDLARHLFRSLVAAHVDGNRRAAVVQPRRRGSTQSARCAGDERDAANEVSRCVITHDRPLSIRRDGLSHSFHQRAAPVAHPDGPTDMNAANA